MIAWPWEDVKLFERLDFSLSLVLLASAIMMECTSAVMQTAVKIKWMKLTSKRGSSYKYMHVQESIKCLWTLDLGTCSNAHDAALHLNKSTVKSRPNAHHRANAHPPFQRQKSCKGVIFLLVIAQSVYF